jgi:hypothetical protein
MEINYLALAQAGYEAYAATTGNKNFRGEEMPRFRELPANIVNAWVEAARRICADYAAAIKA